MAHVFTRRFVTWRIVDGSKYCMTLVNIRVVLYQTFFSLF